MTSNMMMVDIFYWLFGGRDRERQSWWQLWWIGRKTMVGLVDRLTILSSKSSHFPTGIAATRRTLLKTFPVPVPHPPWSPSPLVIR
eukprot:scaffold34622_cov162-Amphora_coffeaeformis.AAC.9